MLKVDPDRKDGGKKAVVKVRPNDDSIAEVSISRKVSRGGMIRS